MMEKKCQRARAKEGTKALDFVFSVKRPNALSFCLDI